MVTAMLPLVVILAILRITKAECPEVIKTTKNRDGFINYKSTNDKNCTWTLVKGLPVYNILMFDLRNISLRTEFQQEKRLRGILKLPETGGIVSLGPTNCYVYMRSSAECDIPSTRKRIRAVMNSCENHFLYSDIKQLPWNDSITLQSILPGPKSFTLFYRYGKCVQTGKIITPESRKKNIVERPDPSTSYRTQIVSYPIVVSILTCFLFISIGVIVWTQVKLKKLADEYLNNHIGHVTVSPASCVPPTQDGDTGVYQVAVESTLSTEPSPTYAEINCNVSVGGSVWPQENMESYIPTTQSATPVYAKVKRG